MHLTENWFKGELVDPDLSYSYTKYKLKNGKIVSYNFGNAKAGDMGAMSKEFFDWFESKPPYKDIKNPKLPSLDEENCVKEFYNRFINKDEKTDTVEVNDYLNLEDFHQSLPSLFIFSLNSSSSKISGG